MLREIQQVLRWVMLWGKQRDVKTAGGLCVLLWTEGTSVQTLNCTVAAAGSRWTGVKMELSQSVLADLEQCMPPCAWLCPQPDPKELCAFTELYGSLSLCLCFQMKDARLLSPEWCASIEVFLHSFSLANATIGVHLKFKFGQNTYQQDFRAKLKWKAANQPWMSLDVTCYTQPPQCVNKGYWCEGGHPVLGGRVSLSVPPEAMERGLFGELSVQPVTVWSPCVLQYPNLVTQLTHIKQVLVCGPSNVPITGPSNFLQTLPAHLDCQELGLRGLHCASVKDVVHGGYTVYTAEQESSLPSVQQSLLLYLFLQHSDPFTEQLSDMMVTEVLIEQHLEDILSNNRQSLTTALQTVLKNSLKDHNRRKKNQKTLHSAAEVILSSSISIVSCSSNMDFREACLNSMQVQDTCSLSSSLRESLRKVTSWKYTPKSRCHSTPMEEHRDKDNPLRAEM